MKQKVSLSFKQATVAAALNRPGDVSLKQCAKERGIGYSTLQNWLRLVRKGKLGEASSATSPRERRPVDWTTDEKWQAVWDCAGKDETAKATYCRERGVFKHHLEQWKQELMSTSQSNDQTLRNEMRALKEENKQLKRELARKEKALAEAAALITLRKKLATLWAQDEEK